MARHVTDGFRWRLREVVGTVTEISERPEGEAIAEEIVIPAPISDPFQVGPRERVVPDEILDGYLRGEARNPLPLRVGEEARGH